MASCIIRIGWVSIAFTTRTVAISTSMNQVAFVVGTALRFGLVVICLTFISSRCSPTRSVFGSCGLLAAVLAVSTGVALDFVFRCLINWKNRGQTERNPTFIAGESYSAENVPSVPQFQGWGNQPAGPVCFICSSASEQRPFVLSAVRCCRFLPSTFRVVTLSCVLN